ncbi:hypothetical protein AAF712_004452 [Marasmius tenuissimus]|uniref:Uncharacterized protein n=1 Tax=Marasmius tenuissimus TaxID=585030 RepID=A0ABR3A4R5_9AGAR
MSQPTNFGDTLSSGIQDVAALLPLLGTEQCERHVGTALEKGYLYAAATPLSIFGSLGIVKTAFATLLATTTRPFYGASWLDDAGFGTTGSVSSMVTLMKGTQRYGAEVRLQCLMEEQHIDDPDLIADIEWYGWERKKTVDGAASSFLPPFSWNVSLILTSLLSSLVSISPYLYLIHNSWGSATLWLFPLLRSFGALLCVVSIQFALQVRIHRITKTSLQLMKERKESPLPTEEAIKDRDTLLEARLRNPRVEPSDPEKQSGSGLGHWDGTEARGLSQDILLPLLQTILIVGMGMIVAGYVGCFNIVGRTNVDAGPYVWFGMETFLAMLRIALWGWNPRWDEGDTGMTMRLALHNRDPTNDVTTSTSPANPPRPTFPTPDPPEGVQSDPKALDPPFMPFPLITTPRVLSLFTKPAKFTSGWRRYKKDSFIVEHIEDFLAAATPYMGPLRRLEMEELKGILLCCGIVPDGERRLLCVTACRTDSQPASISIFIDGNTPLYAMYTSHSRDVPGTRALRVTLEDEVQLGSVDTIIDRRTLDSLVDYSSRLFGRLCMTDSDLVNVPLLWTVTLPSLPSSQKVHKQVPLTELDKAYIYTRQIQELKSDYCVLRGNMLIGVFPLNETEKWNDEMLEWAALLESTVMEVYLCICERRLVRPMALSSAHSRRLALERESSMEDRILLEKELCRRRRADVDPKTLFQYESTYDLLVRELRSLRQLPIGSPVLEDWERLIDTIMDQPHRLPAVSALLGLPPLQSLGNLTSSFLPLFASSRRSDFSTSGYPNMIALLRSSLYRLRDAKASSFHDPIDPWGPESPEFKPPYTRVHEVSESASKALLGLVDEVQIIEINYAYARQKPLLKALHLLDTLPSSQSLATVKFSNSWFSAEATHLVVSVLQRQPGIICLAFEDCDFDDRALIDASVATNRQQWKEEAQRGGVFTYRVGCEIHHGDHSNSAPFLVYQHDILLSHLADLFAMIYIPQEGRVIPSVSLQAHAEDITLVASLTPSDNVGEDGNSDGDSDDTLTTQSDVTVSFGFGSTSIEGFPELKAGCYELRIRLLRRAQYLFRRLTIDFRVAGSYVVEPPPGEPGAESIGSVSSSSSSSSRGRSRSRKSSI